MRADCTGEIRRARQPGLQGNSGARAETPVHTRWGEWADAAPVSGIKCVGLVKSCPGGPASKVYDVGVDDIRLLQRRRKRK